LFARVAVTPANPGRIDPRGAATDAQRVPNMGSTAIEKICLSRKTPCRRSKQSRGRVAPRTATSAIPDLDPRLLLAIIFS
jgi:hypothetical protein